MSNESNAAGENNSGGTDEFLENVLLQTDSAGNWVKPWETGRRNPDGRDGWVIAQRRQTRSKFRSEVDSSGTVPKGAIRGRILPAHQRRSNEDQRGNGQQTPTPAHAVTWETTVCSKESGKPRLS